MSRRPISYPSDHVSAGEPWILMLHSSMAITKYFLGFAIEYEQQLSFAIWHEL